MKSSVLKGLLVIAFLGVVLFLNWAYVFISDDCFYGSMFADGRWQHLGSIANALTATLRDPHRPVVHFLVRIFTGCLDKWFFNVCNTAMMGALILLTNRLAFGHWRIDLRTMILAMTMAFFTLFKGESLTWCAGSVNYLWVAVMTMVLCLVRERLEERDTIPLWQLTLFVVTAVLCGGSNETFTPPMCFAIGVCALLDLRNLSARKVIVYLAYFLPVVAMALYEKANRVGGMMPELTLSTVVITFLKIAVTVKCVWAMVVCFLLKKDKIGFLRRNRFELLVVFSSVAMVLGVGFHGERTLYCANLFALIVVLREWMPNRVVCGVGVLAMIVVSALLVPKALTIRTNVLTFLEQYLAADDSVACHEFVDCGPLGWYFYQEIYNWQTIGAHPQVVANYYGGKSRPIGLSRTLYNDVYLQDKFCVPQHRLKLSSDIKAYTTKNENTIVVPLVDNETIDPNSSVVRVSYNYPTGIKAMLKRNLAILGRPTICEPEHPVLLKTSHGNYFLVAKDVGSDDVISGIVLK